MEIYKDLSSTASQEFEKLLNSQLSKVQIEEGKIIEGKINKITEKFVFLFVEGLKSEPVLDINELKSMGLADKIKVGETIKVIDGPFNTFEGEVALIESNRIDVNVRIFGRDTKVSLTKEQIEKLKAIKKAKKEANIKLRMFEKVLVYLKQV